jgi:hypothetical protein
MVTVIIAWIVVGLAALAGFVLIQYARKNRKPKVVGYEPARPIKVPTNLYNPYASKHEWAGSYRVTKQPTYSTLACSAYTPPSDDSFSTGLITGIVAEELLTDNTPSPSCDIPATDSGFGGFGSDGGGFGGGGADGSWTPDTSSSSYDSGSSSSYDHLFEFVV